MAFQFGSANEYNVFVFSNLNLWRDFLNFPYFTGFPAPLNSEMICIFPYFCPYAESAREIREVFI